MRRRSTLRIYLHNTLAPFTLEISRLWRSIARTLVPPVALYRAIRIAKRDRTVAVLLEFPPEPWNRRVCEIKERTVIVTSRGKQFTNAFYNQCDRSCPWSVSTRHSLIIPTSVPFPAQYANEMPDRMFMRYNDEVIFEERLHNGTLHNGTSWNSNVFFHTRAIIANYSST